MFRSLAVSLHRLLHTPLSTASFNTSLWTGTHLGGRWVFLCQTLSEELLTIHSCHRKWKKIRLRIMKVDVLYYLLTELICINSYSWQALHVWRCSCVWQWISEHSDTYCYPTSVKHNLISSYMNFCILLCYLLNCVLPLCEHVCVALDRRHKDYDIWVRRFFWFGEASPFFGGAG